MLLQYLFGANKIICFWVAGSVKTCHFTICSNVRPGYREGVWSAYNRFLTTGGSVKNFILNQSRFWINLLLQKPTLKITLKQWTCANYCSNKKLLFVYINHFGPMSCGPHYWKLCQKHRWRSTFKWPVRWYNQLVYGVIHGINFHSNENSDAFIPSMPDDRKILSIFRDYPRPLVSKNRSIFNSSAKRLW